MAAINDNDVFVAEPTVRRERPFLLPWNRRVRHLHGISVRNLNLMQPIRSRGKTITDDNVPSALKSPAKLLAQSETRPLQHSHSFTNLRSPKEEFRPPDKAPTSYGEMESPGQRPRLGKLRRRSTLQWSGSSPRVRQKKLEDVSEGHLVDSWFSIHVQGAAEPIYISEEMEKAMNPSFRAFDLNTLGPVASRTDNLTLKLWAKTSESDTYSLLLELELCLRSLQFIGKALDNFHHPLPPNCVLFHMSDGIYTSFTDLPAAEHPINFLEAKKAKGSLLEEQSSSSYDALMRLANLDDCIQDALAIREKIESQINSLINEHRSALDSTRVLAQAEHSLTQAQRASAVQRKQIRNDQKLRDELQETINSRRIATKAAQERQETTSSILETVVEIIPERLSEISRLTEASAGQIRRICEDLLKIYPIEAIPDKPLQFTIRGLQLPNSKFDDMENKESVAAALGYTAHMVNLLSQYLAVPLPYPIQNLGSSSLIEDPVSIALPQRIFPLYPISVTYRFEYGVFLLNKDIEFLMDRHNLRMLDIRHTLPNLKYLLYVLTAGTGELPSRKAGGVKGLITGRMSPSLSRRSSEDSVINGTIHRIGALMISNKLREREKDEGDNESLSPMFGSPKRGPATFRTSALRLES